MYEVLPTEPLHDIKEHISNVVTEIVAHLPDEEKALCVKAVELVAGTKDQLRGSDYRILSSCAESISHSFASLTRERYLQHSKIKVVSPHGHVISSTYHIVLAADLAQL